MSRKAKNIMSNDSSSLSIDPSKFETDDGKVVIDYRGSIGAAPGQPQVRHERSPWILQWPQSGVPELVIYPGVNVLDAHVWETYKSSIDAVSRACKRGVLRELDGLGGIDDFTLLTEDTGTIARTVSHEGLDWIASQAEGRKLVLEAVVRRKQYARPLAGFEPRPYAQFQSFDKTRSEQLGVRQMDSREAMG
jgi:hypothetical protein